MEEVEEEEVEAEEVEEVLEEAEEEVIAEAVEEAEANLKKICMCKPHNVGIERRK